MDSVYHVSDLLLLFTVMTTGGATIQIANPVDMPGLQTLTMTNAGTPAGTIVQSIQAQDGTQQFFVPTASGKNLAPAF